MNIQSKIITNRFVLTFVLRFQRGKSVKINEQENELTRRISTGKIFRIFFVFFFFMKIFLVTEVSETSKITTTIEQERDLRRHSHIGTFRRGLSKKQNSD